MTYDVIWDPPAEREVTQLWMASRMHHAITSAADKIDEGLRRDPHNCGESRDAGRRVMHEAPLGVILTINVSQRRVRVETVWQY